MKLPLLYLCHRIPYPPDKGDKIRSYNMLKHLLENYRVYLGAFIDDQRDWAHEPYLRELCEDCCFINVHPTKARIRSLSALATGESLTTAYYKSSEMEEWILRTVGTSTDFKLITFSAAMTQFATHKDLQLKRKIADFVDVDSDKWKQYAQKKKWPLSWVYKREAHCLLEFERKMVAAFDSCTFVSPEEADLFRDLAPESREKINYFYNGVDHQYYTPNENSDTQNPYSAQINVIVFTGAMDYWPNIDAVVWFSQNVFPELYQESKSTHFYIVGSNPDAAVQKLASHPNISVTGRVEDIRPYMQFAKVSVAPLRIARGIQNKVLEAMSMTTPVVASIEGAEGITAIPEAEILLASNPTEYIQLIKEILEGNHSEVGQAGRLRVIKDFSWSNNLHRLDMLLEP